MRIPIGGEFPSRISLQHFIHFVLQIFQICKKNYLLLMCMWVKGGCCCVNIDSIPRSDIFCSKNIFHILHLNVITILFVLHFNQPLAPKQIAAKIKLQINKMHRIETLVQMPNFVSILQFNCILLLHNNLSEFIRFPSSHILPISLYLLHLNHNERK